MNRIPCGISHSPRPLAAVSLLVLACAATTASAAEIAYIGLRAGTGEAPDEIVRDGDTYALFAGYRVTPRFAIELVLAERHADDSFTAANGVASVVTVRRKGRVRAIEVLARCDVPLAERWTAHARGGLAWFDASVRTAIPDVSFFESELGGSSAGFVAGIGVDYHIDAAWRLGLELERTMGDFRLRCSGTPYPCRFSRSGSIDAASVSLTYAF
jgi:opacity protein-like surface antigen